jgi:hypothetical protein
MWTGIRTEHGTAHFLSRREPARSHATDRSQRHPYDDAPGEAKIVHESRELAAPSLIEDLFKPEEP